METIDSDVSSDMYTDCYKISNHPAPADKSRDSGLNVPLAHEIEVRSDNLGHSASNRAAKFYPNLKLQSINIRDVDIVTGTDLQWRDTEYAVESY